MPNTPRHNIAREAGSGTAVKLRVVEATVPVFPARLAMSAAKKACALLPMKSLVVSPPTRVKVMQDRRNTRSMNRSGPD